MRLMVIGLNHKTTPVYVREKFSFTRKLLHESLATLKACGLINGAVILSTCNRIEIYFSIENSSPDIENAKTLVFSMFRADKSVIERYFYIFEDISAIRHLFRVASGLDSQVLGECQILAQVRSAWAISKEARFSNDMLDCIFEKAQEAGRMVRSQTKISQGNISIGSVAIKMLKDRLGCLDGYSALIIGAGKIGALISKYLKEEKMKAVFVASRTYERALELASDCGGRAVDFTKLEEELKGVDIVISSTSSPHIILKKEMLVRAMKTGRDPLFIMDLAMPRDVDPCARDIDGVYLYDLDDLKGIVEENYKQREKEAVLAERLIQKELENILIDGKEVKDEMPKKREKKDAAKSGSSKTAADAISYRLKCAKTANGLSHFVMYGDVPKKSTLV